ncbi:hypothetical protein [Cellulosimicrobium cellulans]|uniref:hypothetical protein n=1 Tax=Cellulosimicrobium cellulans TaxID=1710 RepID=UPI00130DD868|nr:hypothetical protein [Cellulosimicrobium cellulans]
MGATNVLRAFVAAEQATLPAPARLILVRMAVTAKDDDDPPRYFAGWELLAQAIGYPLADVSEGMPRRESARRHVRRLVKELEMSGLLTRDGRAFSGRNAEYHLHLAGRLGDTSDPSRRPARTAVGVTSDPSEGVISDPARGGSRRSGLGDTSDPSKEEEEPGTGDRTGRSAPSPTPHQGTKHSQGDDDYAAAREALNRAGALAGDLIAAARREQPDATTREAILLAASRLSTRGAA